MLLYQAVAQVELMTGHPGPVEAMRTALVAAVAKSSYAEQLDGRGVPLRLRWNRGAMVLAWQPSFAAQSLL